PIYGEVPAQPAEGLDRTKVGLANSSLRCHDRRCAGGQHHLHGPIGRTLEPDLARYVFAVARGVVVKDDQAAGAQQRQELFRIARLTHRTAITKEQVERTAVESEAP